MTKLERKQRYWRMAVRRFNYWDGPFSTRKNKWRGEPSWAFLARHPRLAVLWFFKRLIVFRRRIDWHVDQHNCGCYGCKHEKRKHVGNAAEGKPMQERRERIKMDAMVKDGE